MLINLAVIDTISFRKQVVTFKRNIKLL